MRVTRAMAAGLALAMLGGAAGAAEADRDAEAVWATRLDVRAAMESRVGEFVREVAERPGVDRGLSALKILVHVDLLRDIDSLTLVGRGRGPEDVVLLVRGRFDKEHLTGLVSLAEGHRTLDHAGATIHAWRDRIAEIRKRRPSEVFAAFAADEHVVLSPDERAIRSALDSLAGARRDEAVELGQSLASEPCVLAAAARGVSDIEEIRAQTAVLEHVSELRASLRPEADGLSLVLTATAEDEVTASRIEAVIRGLQALTLLDQGMRPTVAAIAERATVERTDRTVRLVLTATLEELREFERARRRAGARLRERLAL